MLCFQTGPWHCLWQCTGLYQELFLLKILFQVCKMIPRYHTGTSTCRWSGVSFSWSPLKSKSFHQMKVKVTQSCRIVATPMDYTVHGILQARMLECAAFPFSRGYSQPRDQTQVSRTMGRFFTSWATRKPRILEWVVYPLSSGSSWPRNWTGVSRTAGGFFTNWAIREAPCV